jgi:hypothetical protein
MTGRRGSERQGEDEDTKTVADLELGRFRRQFDPTAQPVHNT